MGSAGISMCVKNSEMLTARTALLIRPVLYKIQTTPMSWLRCPNNHKYPLTGKPSRQRSWTNKKISRPKNKSRIFRKRLKN